MYRTPAGFRLLAMHWVFTPADPKVADLFAAVRADPCHFECELGWGMTDSKARVVQGLHDGLCRAGSGLPLA